MRERGHARTAAAAGLAVLVACATAGDPAPAAAARFADVRSLVLVREGDRGARPKDPLDGLDETLRARGFTTRVVELGRDRLPEQATIERLFRQLEARAAASRSERIATPVRELGREAGEMVARLGVDAVASYHRLDRFRPPPAAPLPPLGGPGMTAAPPPAPLPLGALVLLDRSGHLATFAWGDAGSLDEPGMPLNAAEAIEQLVRALTGAEPDPE